MASTVIGPKPLHEESREFIQSKLIEHVPRFAQGTDQQAGNLVGALEAIIEHQLWRYAGCDSLADYANKYLGHSDTWCREVVRIFMEDWSTEKREVGTIGELNTAAEQAAKARAQADPESGEYVDPKGGAPKGNRNAAKEKEETTPSNTRGCSAKKMNGCVDKPGILRRLARERPDLLERFERGELTANAAAIEAGFRKVKSPLDQAIAAFQRLSPDDRVTFMELAASMMEHDRRSAALDRMAENAKELGLTY